MLPDPATRIREIVGIQYLRGFAAIAVALDHTAGMAAMGKYFGGNLWDGLTHGNLGVDLFFLISGFIICVVSLQGPRLTPAIGLGAFAWKRFIRVIPLMWVAIIAFAGFRLLGRGVFPFPYYVHAFFLLPGMVEPSQVWTLRHEAIFYVLFGLSFLTARRWPWLLALWFLSPAVWLLLPYPSGQGMISAWLSLIANPVNLEFGAGFLVGILWLKNGQTLSFRTPISPVLLLAGLVFLLGLAGSLLSLGLHDFRSVLIAAAICLPILLAGVYVRCPPGSLDRIGRILGDASFSIYLFHPPIVSAVLGLWSHFFRATPVGVVIFVTAIVAVGGGILVHLFVERPLLKALRTLHRRPVLQ